MKNYELLNYLLPVQVGAPDYFFHLINKMISFYSNVNNISLFKNTVAQTQVETNTNQFLGPYLAGLLEGDGHISLSKTINSKGKISYPYIAITFVNKDLPLILKLHEKFGGRLRFKNKENAIVWIINKHEPLVKLINLMNGYLRTPKIIKFNNIIYIALFNIKALSIYYYLITISRIIS